MNILVVKLGSIGDIVFALAYLGVLRNKWPDPRILAERDAFEMLP